jgi:aryl-alcohol dehydrogenase-like predicted oxidoreductase
VIYNIFDQAPEDELFPACRENVVAVIARVPLDEGSLTGTLTLESTWPAEDWRSTYFVPENLKSSVAHAEALKALVPAGMTMAEMALRFILSNPDVSTVIPGMRKSRHVEANLAASDAGPLPPDLLTELRRHRWDRQPTAGRSRGPPPGPVPWIRPVSAHFYACAVSRARRRRTAGRMPPWR